MHPARKWLLILVGSLGAFCLLVLAIVSFKWPFTQQKIARDLEQATSSKLEIQAFHATYFPRPGCEIDGLVFRRPKSGSSGPPLVTVSKIRIQGSFLGLFTKHVGLVRVYDMHAVIPPFNTGGWSESKSPSDVIVDHLVADEAVLEFARQDPHDPPLKFLLHKFSIHGLGSNGRMRFETALRNPEPPGEVRSSGTFGPWRSDDPRQTPLAGTYTFRDADLGAFSGIAGKLDSDGKFDGVLNKINVQGTTKLPDFEVKRSGHKIPLKSDFQATVDATNGDVRLGNVNSEFWGTLVRASGSIAGGSGDGKTASIDLSSRQGRIQDLFMIFTNEPHSPLNGTVNFKGHATLPPGEGPFVRKIQFQAAFGIDDAQFANANTRHDVATLSERARGEKPKDDDDNKKKPDASDERVLSDLKGHVLLKGGVATFTDLSFGVPGALAQMHGTYDLVSERINMSGILHIRAKPSDATSGIKSVLMKALGPFLKNNHPRAIVPFTMTGTYSHPSYSVSTPK
jgi:hypothetical protein